MNSLPSIKNLYHPYKITIKGNIYIIDSTEGKFILKKENKDLFTLYSYLSNRGITSYPELIRNFNEEENLLEYIYPINLPIEQTLDELASTIGNIHLKTSYNKNISIDEIKEIKENIESNINYLNNKYQSKIKNILLNNIISPKDYLFIRYYYKIQEALDYCSKEINNWFLLIKEKNQIRLSLIHNNLSLEHFIISKDKNILISWDNYRFDIPLIDIVSFIKNSDLKDNYSGFLNKYFSIFPYEEDEKKLLFILISLPDYFNDDDPIDIIKTNINKIFQIEDLIRPYYTKDEEK